MLNRDTFALSAANRSILRAIFVWSMLLLFAACGSNKKKLAEAITERDSLPVMDSRGVTTLVSDSGVTRYRIVTDQWQIFDKKVPSYWAFEKGVYLEKYDTLLQVEASIEADTAYFFDKKKLWHLIGNVEIKNLEGDKFETSELFWDQSKETVYNNKHIEITQKDKKIVGNGFESNQGLTKYAIRDIEGIFYINTTDTIRPAATDSVAQPVDSTKLKKAPQVTPSKKPEAEIDQEAKPVTIHKTVNDTVRAHPAQH